MSVESGCVEDESVLAIVGYEGEVKDHYPLLRNVALSFFFSSRRRHTRWTGDWSSDVCSSDLHGGERGVHPARPERDDLARARRALAAGGLGGDAGGLAEEAQQRGLVLRPLGVRSEERRVGKECRCRWAP